MTTLFEMLNNDSIKAIAKNTVKVGEKWYQTQGWR